MRHLYKWTTLAEHPWTSDGRLLTQEGAFQPSG